MKLRDFSRRIQSEEQPDFTYALQGSLDLAELSVAKLVNFPDTIYIVNSQSVAFGKIQKETLLYLLDRQQKFQFVYHFIRNPRKRWCFQRFRNLGVGLFPCFFPYGEK